MSLVVGRRTRSRWQEEGGLERKGMSGTRGEERMGQTRVGSVFVYRQR